MSKSDVEMENAEKNPHDLENKVQDSENKAPDSNIEGEGGKLSCVDAVSDDSSKMKNHLEGINGSRNEDKDSVEVKEQTNLKTEGDEPIDESIPEQIGMIDEIEKPIDIKTEDEEMSAMDVDNNASENNITSGEEEKQEKSTKNCLDGENNLGIVEEKSNENLAHKEPKELAKGGLDYVEHIEGDNKSIPKEDADRVENVPGENMSVKTDDAENDPTELSSIEAHQTQNAEMGEVPLDEVDKMKHSSNSDGDTAVKHTEEDGEKVVLAKRETGENNNTVETTTKHDEDASFANQQEPSTPNSFNRDSLAKAVDHSGGTAKSVFTPTALPLMGEDDDGTPDDQVAFMKEIESFYKLKAIDFKPPKFYGQPLNCLKLWRAVIRLGGYDRVTGSKLWRQVGESFHPPKTCTTVSWTFRIFYEKSLLEYERHKIQSGELQLPTAAFPEASGVDVEGNGHQGSGRARRDAAARAMQGWHTQRLSDYGEVGEPIMKDKNLNNVAKREKNLKSIGSLKQKRPSEAEHSNKAPRIETPKQLTTSVVDVGPPADWVKINVQQTKDCFEIYALVPGLLREEVRVQTDPAGRVVITGQPEQVDNPWGITPFRKVVSLPSRIDPIQTSAVVSLHGRLFIRVPFEQQPNP